MSWLHVACVVTTETVHSLLSYRLRRRSTTSSTPCSTWCLFTSSGKEVGIDLQLLHLACLGSLTSIRKYILLVGLARSNSPDVWAAVDACFVFLFNCASCYTQLHRPLLLLNTNCCCFLYYSFPTSFYMYWRANEEIRTQLYYTIFYVASHLRVILQCLLKVRRWLYVKAGAHSSCGYNCRRKKLHCRDVDALQVKKKKKQFT